MSTPKRSSHLRVFIDEKKELTRIRVVKGKYGVIYVAQNERLNLLEAIPFAAGPDGNCIGFDNVKGKINLDEFNARIKRLAKAKDWQIIGGDDEDRDYS